MFQPRVSFKAAGCILRNAYVNAAGLACLSQKDLQSERLSKTACLRDPSSGSLNGPGKTARRNKGEALQLRPLSASHATDEAKGKKPKSKAHDRHQSRGA